MKNEKYSATELAALLEEAAKEAEHSSSYLRKAELKQAAEMLRRMIWRPINENTPKHTVLTCRIEGGQASLALPARWFDESENRNAGWFCVFSQPATGIYMEIPTRPTHWMHLQQHEQHEYEFDE